MLQNDYKHETSILKNQKKSLKTLNTVPCGTQYPSCRFIKDSHKNKKLLPKQEEKISNLIDKIDNTTRKFHNAIEEKLELQLENYKKYENTESQLKVSISEFDIVKQRIQYELDKVQDNLKDATIELRALKKKIINTKHVNNLISTKVQLKKLNEHIKNADHELMTTNGHIMLSENHIKQLNEEKETYVQKRNKWHIFELLINAFSKNGIPAQIITNQLPLINAEIANILHNTCNFTLTFDSKHNSNQVEIYIDYGDSRRRIETASGMEKIISSLAIRVALINVSSLPKTNLLVIDEGFGSLDENNLEACGQFLNSLKRYFKNILIISHIDGVKDMVDNLLEITKIHNNSKVVYD